MISDSADMPRNVLCYSGHAVRRMVERGITERQVEESCVANCSVCRWTRPYGEKGDCGQSSTSRAWSSRHGARRGTTRNAHFRKEDLSCGSCSEDGSTMATSAISIDTTQFDYCPRMKVKALRLPCGEREECAGCERSPEFLKYQQKQKRKQEQDEKRRNHLGRLEEKTCGFCGKKFMGIKKRRFCSYACSSHGKHHTRSEKVCLVCGMTFMGTKQQIYCSRVCKDRSHYKRLGGDE